MRRQAIAVGLVAATIIGASTVVAAEVSAADPGVARPPDSTVLGTPLPRVNPDDLVSARTLQSWHERKDREGPTFAGSPSWRKHVEWVEKALRRRGVVDLRRDVIEYPRWWVDGESAYGLRIDGREIPVASYWAYSGSTPDAGITAPLVYYDAKAPESALDGRIVVFDVPPLPDPLPAPFQPPGHEFATPDLASDLTRPPSRLATDHWYQVNYATRFGRLGEILKAGNAAGGLVVFDMGAERARGLYTFPLLTPGETGVPGLYLDRTAGATAREAAKAGRTATLRLSAQRATAKTWFLTGVLPGRHYGTDADESVLLITHTDGPNLTQENGALAILALVDYFAKQPVDTRRRSLLIVLDPQHYMPGRHLVDWFDEHPDRTSRIVASMGVEQLGQKEYAERGDEFVPTGRPEITILQSRDDPQLIAWAKSAIEAQGLPRTVLRVPGRKGQGRWTGLGEVAVERNWPAYGTSTDMSAYWSTVPGIESFDATLCFRQIAVLASLTGALMSADLPRSPDGAPAAPE